MKRRFFEERTSDPMDKVRKKIAEMQSGMTPEHLAKWDNLRSTLDEIEKIEKKTSLKKTQ